MKEIIYYQTLDNKIPYLEWYNALDKSLRLIVDKRLSKVERGLFGKNKQLADELFELKFDNGLRIYYTEADNTIFYYLQAVINQNKAKILILQKNT